MRAKEGDKFAIPGANNFGLAKVIYCSKYFKDVILIKLYKVSFSSPDLGNIPENSEYVLYYTGMRSIKLGKWENVGYEDVDSREEKLSRRIVAGDVWEADKHIGPASDKELTELPKMLTYGYRLIEKAVTGLKNKQRKVIP